MRITDLKSELKEMVDGAMKHHVDVLGEDLKKEFGEIIKHGNKTLGEITDRLEELEMRAKSPGKTSALSTKAREHRQLFESWLRKPGDSSRELKLRNFEDVEFKDVTVGTGAAGGFAMPEEISREIGRLEEKFSPVRGLVKVVRASSGDYKMLIDKTGTTSGWVAETGTRSATATPTLRERVPTFGELYAYPQASEWSLDDVFFDVGAWLADSIAREFAKQTGAAVISGNGTSKPTGLLNTTPVSTADFASPERSANALQLITSDLTPGGSGIVPDSLLDLVYTVNSEYRANATFAMNSLTAAAIRKLKDADGQYLWQAGLIAGQPDRLLGYPVAIWENVPDIALNAFPVIFGDFMRGYQLVDRTEIRILRDPYTNPGHVRFYARRRLGGHVWDNHALKVLQTI